MLLPYVALFALMSSHVSAASFPGGAPQPWLPLHGGGFTGHAVPSSPDPLVSYVWPDIAAVNDTLLQIFPVTPVSCGPAPGSDPASFINATLCGSSPVIVGGNGTLLIDFGVELPGWFEIDSPDLTDADLGSLEFGISEYTVPDYVGGFKVGSPKKYGTTYRLETNGELYEGVRYGFLIVHQAPSTPFTVTAFRAVSQAKPVNYVGHFSSAGDPILERVYYTAAYTVRATLQSQYMGSILMDRGDRFSWMGDAYPTEATSMAVFGNYPFVFNNLNRSKGDCQGIATYCLYFVLSVAGYWKETGDVNGTAYLAPNVVGYLEEAIGRWENPQGLRFVGWDDRTGSGFANNTTPETQAMYRLIAIRAWQEGAAMLNALGGLAPPGAAARYASAAANRTADIRAMGPPGGGPWWGDFGLHAGADAVNAGFLNPTEAAGIAGGPIGDPVQLPSQSNFNQYFILQALSGLGQLDRGLESIRAIWGPITTLGATTFWETSHPSAAMIFPPGPPPPAAEQSGWVSYCHPWASGPTPWLAQWALGVRPLSPGYASSSSSSSSSSSKGVLVSPHVGGSMRGVSGTVPTPLGPVHIHVGRCRATATASTTATSPACVEGEVGGEGVIRVTLPSGIPTGVLRITAALLTRLGLPLPKGRATDDLTDPGLLLGIRVRSAAVVAASHHQAPVSAPGVSAPGSIPGDVVVYGAWKSVTLLPAAITEGLPLKNESNPALGFTAALEFALKGGVAYEFHVAMGSSGSGSGIGAVGGTWFPEGSPFPPPIWPGSFLGANSSIGGDWVSGGIGGAGYVLIGYDVPSPSGSNPFCGSVGEGSPLTLQCTAPGATISAITYASFGGTPGGGGCGNYTPPTCDAPSSLPTVKTACLGKAQCTVQATNAVFGGDPCPGVGKSLYITAECSTGGGIQPGGSGSVPTPRVKLPPWVASARVVNYDGYCGATFNWVNASTDTRALEDPDQAAAGRRSLGATQPCGCPTSPFDIALTSAAKGKRYRLGLYFVDFARSPNCGGLDGSARSQEVYLLTGYPALAPATQRQALTDFAGGVWWFYEVEGDIRVRISTIVGDMAVLSAVTFDEL